MKVRVLLTGIIAASIVAPAASAASKDLVQIDGRLVAPAQVSEAQLAAGHAPSSRLVQIGGALVEPTQLSTWQNRADRGGSTTADDGSSFEFGTAAVGAASALGGLILVASATVLVRRRRGFATA